MHLLLPFLLEQGHYLGSSFSNGGLFSFTKRGLSTSMMPEQGVRPPLKEAPRKLGARTENSPRHVGKEGRTGGDLRTSGLVPQDVHATSSADLSGEMRSRALCHEFNQTVDVYVGYVWVLHCYVGSIPDFPLTSLYRLMAFAVRRPCHSFLVQIINPRVSSQNRRADVTEPRSDHWRQIHLA